MEYTKDEGFAERDFEEPKPQKTEQGYTKGEWKVSSNQRNLITSGDNEICTLPESYYIPDCGDRTWYNSKVEVMKANAHLIAKSPRMYELLDEIVSTELNADTLRILQPWLNKVIAVLA